MVFSVSSLRCDWSRVAKKDSSDRASDSSFGVSKPRKGISVSGRGHFRISSLNLNGGDHLTLGPEKEKDGIHSQYLRTSTAFLICHYYGSFSNWTRVC